MQFRRRLTNFFLNASPPDILLYFWDLSFLTGGSDTGPTSGKLEFPGRGNVSNDFIVQVFFNYETRLEHKAKDVTLQTPLSNAQPNMQMNRAYSAKRKVNPF